MQNNTDEQVYAGFFVRLAAYIIDCIIVGAALLAVRFPMWLLSLSGATGFLYRDFIFKYSVYDIVLYLLKVTYFVLLTYFTGSTLGKRLLQIQVVSAENRKLTFFEIVFRESVGRFLSALIIYVGYFMIGADRKKRGLHDILSDTCVVYHHRKTVAVPTPVTYNTIPYAVQMPPYQTEAAQKNPYVQPMNHADMPPQSNIPPQPPQQNRQSNQQMPPLEEGYQRTAPQLSAEEEGYQKAPQQGTFEEEDSFKANN